MKRGKMDRVAAVARIAEQQSAKELGLALKSHQEKLAQLEQLVQFKTDYEANLNSVAGSGMAAKQLQDYRLFLTKLTAAIEQQEQEVSEAQLFLDQQREQWLAKSSRKSALDHLVQGEHKAKVQARDKAEQKESDENSMARRMLNID